MACLDHVRQIPIRLFHELDTPAPGFGQRFQGIENRRRPTDGRADGNAAAGRMRGTYPREQIEGGVGGVHADAKLRYR